MLEWLDANRAKAGEKYEVIRNGLIDMFYYKGCVTSEDLADETIDRVSRRVVEIKDSYSGDPTRYFYGVGKRVYKEYLKRKQHEPLPVLLKAPQVEEVEQQYECLDQRKQAKINKRRAILEMLNLKPSALRVRVFRIRQTLERCVGNCMELREES
jgi:DNA-directed RNA polymerase specialized sigma24 family protein